MNAEEGDRPVWSEAFNKETREDQMRDDSDAWHAVTGLLLAIISVGVCLAVFTTWMTS